MKTTRWSLCLLLLALLVSASQRCSACSCTGPLPHKCGLLKHSASAIFLGTVVSDKSGYRFRVDEAFEGVDGPYVNVFSLACARHFELGRQYVVFADRMPPEQILIDNLCSMTTPVEYGQAILKQLRAERSGGREAQLYGMLRLIDAPNLATTDPTFRKMLAGVEVTLTSGGKSFKATTDEHGAYAFKKLPGGTYDVSLSNLPPNSELARWYPERLDSLILPSRRCYMYDITAMPTGEITGHVFGPDGEQLKEAAVDLYRIEKFKDGESGSFQLQKNDKPFRFRRLAPGDYLLVYNPLKWLDPDSPFPRTFYPNAPDLANAQVIHLSSGQTLTSADIHVQAPPLPTRSLTVRLLWKDNRESLFRKPNVIAHATRGQAPSAHEIAANTYKLKLLLDATYTISAEANCQVSMQQAKTDSVTIDGKDHAVTELTLTFSKQECNKD